MRGKLKELRESRHMTQTGMGMELGVTQQNVSRYEQDINSMPVEMLEKAADFFAVTTDYLLGRTDVKRNLEGQLRVNKAIDEYYDLVETFRDLDKRDQEIIWATIETMNRTKKE